MGSALQPGALGRVDAAVAGGEIVTVIQSPRAFTEALARVKAAPGRKWDKARKAWVFPATSVCAAELRAVMAPEFSVRGCARFEALVGVHNAGLAVLRGEGCGLESQPQAPGRPKLMAHQNLGVALIAARDGSYLAWEMGTGKTAAVIAAAEMLGARRVLIVCPKAVGAAWVKQWPMWGGDRSVVNLTGGAIRERAGMMRFYMTRIQEPVAFVVNYEAVWSGELGEAIMEAAKSGGWDLVCFDEAHRLKDARGKVSTFAFELSRHCKRRVALSGTPVQSTPMDLFAQLRFVDPGVFGTSYANFQAEYAHKGGFGGHQILGFKNLKALNERFHMVAHRVTKDECLDLPPFTDEVIEIELGAKGRKIYAGIEDEFLAEFEDGSITIQNALVELLRLQQLTGGHVKYDEEAEPALVDTAKRDALAEILADVAPGDAVAVFARFRADLDAIHAAADAAGRTSAELSGRRSELAEWQAAGGPAVLAVQINAGGVGIDLTRAAVQVYYSCGFSWGDYDQSRARVHRQGQTRAVTYYHLICKDTVDEAVYRALTGKARNAAAVVESGALAREVIDIRNVRRRKPAGAGKGQNTPLAATGL